MKKANPGEQVTLRAAIIRTTKSARIAAIKKEVATNAAADATAKAVAAKEAFVKADPRKPTYNDIVAAHHEADDKLDVAVEAEKKASDAALRSEHELASALAYAKAAYAI